MDRKCSLSIHAVTWGFPSSASRTLAWTNRPEFSWVFKFVWGGVKENVFIVFVHISHFLPKYVDIKACMAYAHMFLDWFSLSSLTCNIHDSRLNQRCRVFLLFVSEFSKGSFVPRLLIFVLKCILFFILHDTVINYIYRKDCDYCGCPHAPHFGTVDYCEWGGVTTFASNLARKFYSNVFFYWETIVLWLCVQVRPKCVWACACMCLYKRRRGCMVCYDSPDGLRLPVPGYDE